MKHLQGLWSAREELKKRDAVVVAIVSDKPESIAAFRQHEGFGEGLDILSDREGASFRALGVARAGKVKGRPYAHPTTVVLDREGVARFVDIRKALFFWRPSPRKLAAVLDAIH